MQLRGIAGWSRYPNLRAAEALAFTIPLYLLLFVLAYFVMERSIRYELLGAVDPHGFAVLRGPDLVFTTVGFGDIAAKSETARLVVTLQMLLDLLLIGLVVRLFFVADQARSAATPDAAGAEGRDHESARQHVRDVTESGPELRNTGSARAAGLRSIRWRGG